jgi:hypothetical protein
MIIYPFSKEKTHDNNSAEFGVQGSEFGMLNSQTDFLH